MNNVIKKFKNQIKENKKVLENKWKTTILPVLILILPLNFKCID